MMLNREESLTHIVDGIAWLASQAKLRGTIHLFDSHIVVQDFFGHLFNELYDLQLVVTDNIRQNFPAIDLGDETKKRSFQVTAESTSDKIQTTIDAYVAHGLVTRFGKLQVIVIGERQKSYKKLKIPPSLPFVWEDDIIDTKVLIHQINTLGTEKLQRIADVIRREIVLPRKHPTDETRPSQSSKIASCFFPIKLPKKNGTEEVDPAVFSQFSDFFHNSVCRCFGHTCVTTGIEDFVYLLTFEQSVRETDPGFVPFDIALFCHVTEFIRAIEERLEAVIGETAKPLPSLKTLGGTQTLQINPRFGQDMPHRIHRTPPSGIVIQYVDSIPSPPEKPMSTSAMLCLLAAAFKKKISLWDDADKYVDLKKVMTFMDRIDKTGFSWDAIRRDQHDPESWEYAG